MYTIAQAQPGQAQAGSGTGLQLTANYGVHAERYTRQVEERWLEGGRDSVAFSFRDRSELQTFEAYDARGGIVLGATLPAPGRSGEAFGFPGLPRLGLAQGQPAPRWNGPRLPARQAPALALTPPPAAEECTDAEEASPTDGDLRYQITKILFEKLFNMKFSEGLEPARFAEEIRKARESAEQATARVQEAYQNAPAPGRAQPWLDAGVRRTTEVKEYFEFSATLQAQAQNGQGQSVTQSVEVKIRLSSEFVRTEEARVTLGRRKDPLVLDLSGTGIDLTGIENGTVFDLDADGTQERVSWVSGGAALLWMDRNGNNRLDDGSELFGDFRGAADGFEDLASLDQNRDGRVDAEDADFANLRLRTQDGGAAQDQDLERAGVKALYLDKIQLPTELGTQAQVASLGAFQRADGSLGTLADMMLGMDA